MSFTIYQIIHRPPFGNGKRYVGLTKRTVQDRLNAHFNESTREKPRGISPFSLGYAIRDHLLSFPTAPLESAFVIETLQVYTTLEAMRDGESHWIDTLQTMAPAGFNIMRGGSSVGGPSNSKPCEIFLDGKLQTFSSFTDAAKAAAKGEGIIDPIEIKKFVANAKAKMHGTKGKPETRYSLAEALGIEPRDDGRWTQVSRAAKAAGRLVDTERSRNQRQKLREQRLATGDWSDHGTAPLPLQSHTASSADNCVRGPEHQSLDRTLSSGTDRRATGFNDPTGNSRPLAKASGS